MTIKLSNAQLVLMSAAAQRDDRCLVASQQLKGVAVKKVAEKLIGAALVKEVRAKAEMPVWRRDEEGRGFALKLTVAGLKAIAVEDEAGDDGGSSEERAREGKAGLAKLADGVGVGSSDAVAAAPGRQLAPPRANTKLAVVVDLMLRTEGATIEELTAATGWLAHTTRAAITGLRKRNFKVSLDKADKEIAAVCRYAAADLSLKHN